MKCAEEFAVWVVDVRMKVLTIDTGDIILCAPVSPFHA
jgi:hypothetical protein